MHRCVVSKRHSEQHWCKTAPFYSGAGVETALYTNPLKRLILESCNWTKSFKSPWICFCPTLASFALRVDSTKQIWFNKKFKWLFWFFYILWEIILWQEQTSRRQSEGCTLNVSLRTFVTDLEKTLNPVIKTMLGISVLSLYSKRFNFAKLSQIL